MPKTSNTSGELISRTGSSAQIQDLFVIDLEEQFFAQEQFLKPGKRYQLVVQARTTSGGEYFSASIYYKDIPLSAVSAFDMTCFVAVSRSDPAPSC
jgi:hypothetical protein